METLPRLRYDQALLARLPEDTDDAPWMVVPGFQLLIIEMLRSILRQYVRDKGPQWHVFSELWVIVPWPNAHGTFKTAPDLFLVEADDRLRVSWYVEREGKIPQFVLEVVTRESSTRDLDEKVMIYNQMGVREYAIFVPQEVEGQPRLLGYRRDANDAFRRWEPDAQGRLTSDELGGLRLFIADGRWLRLMDRDGRVLTSEAEERDSQTERANHEAARADLALARADQEAARADQAAARAEAAERELARLRLLLEVEAPQPE